VQELEEAEEFERKAAEAHAAAEEALSPEEREKRRADKANSLALVQRLQAYKDETKHQIEEALKSVTHAEMLHCLISEGKATDHEKAETVELLSRGESPIQKLGGQDVRVDGMRERGRSRMGQGVGTKGTG
jgi:polyribonucleotide nucleotidyltransferase